MGINLPASVQTWLKALLSASNWIWPVKFLVGALLGIVAGGGVLSFLLENATHVYALTYGFRPPVEGLPYLRTLVSSGNAIMLLLAAFFATIFLGVLGGMARLLASRHANTAVNLTQTRLWVAIAWSLFGWVALTGLVFFQQKRQGDLGPYCGWPLLHCDPAPDFSLGFILYTFAVAFPMVFMLFRPSFAWVAATGAIAAYYVWVSSNILPPDQYARLLRSTGFGGGMQVLVESHQTDTGCAALNLGGYLLLRTTEQLIVYEAPNSRIHEIPVRCVARVSYGSGGMSSLDYKLPPATTLIERQKRGM